MNLPPSIHDRYVEVVVNDGHDDWMLIKDRTNNSTFLVGTCPRNVQLRVLQSLNYADAKMEAANA